MRVIFAGTPDFAAEALKALLETDHQLVAVYTQPDRPAGRGRKLTPSPVKQLALEHDIPVYQPVSLKGEAEQQELAELRADIMVVVAYGLILPKPVLEAPKHGCLNIHASLLPRWRGAAPIQRAILAGDKETGVTIMQMDVGLDTGDMLLVKKCPIEATDTGSSLHDKLSLMGAEAILQTLVRVENKTLEPQAQDDEEANYADKLSKAEAVIDWQQSAQAIVNKIQAFNSWPVAQTTLTDESGEKVLRLWLASVANSESGSQAPGSVIGESSDGILVQSGDGVVAIHKLQLPGKKATSTADFLNAHSLLDKQLGKQLVSKQDND